jgi:hypothetical protein
LGKNTENLGKTLRRLWKEFGKALGKIWEDFERTWEDFGKKIMEDKVNIVPTSMWVEDFQMII